ncbi:hypothetical protein [Algicola sagamiensis]|uniref:hypothetical protein n=1 Tax=Algicola sagamiensis TaxID=163869 RepID=UPI000372DFBD|nr:hypothetical protein [Algicola sagamiensis]
MKKAQLKHVALATIAALATFQTQANEDSTIGVDHLASGSKSYTFDFDLEKPEVRERLASHLDQLDYEEICGHSNEPFFCYFNEVIDDDNTSFSLSCKGERDNNGKVVLGQSRVILSDSETRAITFQFERKRRWRKSSSFIKRNVYSPQVGDQCFIQDMYGDNILKVEITDGTETQPQSDKTRVLSTDFWFFYSNDRSAMYQYKWKRQGRFPFAWVTSEELPSFCQDTSAINYMGENQWVPATKADAEKLAGKENFLPEGNYMLKEGVFSMTKSDNEVTLQKVEGEDYGIPLCAY